MPPSNAGSARWTKTISDERKHEILRLRYVEGATGAEIIRMAGEGLLPGGPFTLTRYVYDILRDGRESFEADNDQALDNGTAGELKRLHRLALAKARTLNETTDVAEIARTSKALAEAHRALRGQETKQSAPKRAKPSAREAQNDAPEPTKPNDTLAQLVSIAGDASQGAVYAQQSEDGAPGPVRSLTR